MQPYRDGEGRNWLKTKCPEIAKTAVSAMPASAPTVRRSTRSLSSCVARDCTKIYRQCCGLAYASQSESPWHRALSKSQKIRMRLGGGPSVLDLFPKKPPRMHWRTYGRLFNKAAAAQARWIALERDYSRPRFPDALREESAVGR